MPVNSRNKGARGERELASLLRQHGYDARRGQQYSGANGDADVVGLPGIHIECKRCEQVRLTDWMSQSKRDARSGEVPTVWHRRSNEEWLITMRAEDFMEIYKEWESGHDGT